jgi:hypothetical protein
MTLLERQLPQGVLRWEGLLICLLAWAGFLAIPLLQGEIGLSWDALNHHIYLGWTALEPRFDRDFLAAGYQSSQYPFLYWPVYKLATSGWSGMWAGAVLATLHLIAVPPVWMVARTCMPGATVFDALMRAMAVGLAFLSVLVLSLFDSSANDLMAAAPLVWALAFALLPLGSVPLTPAAGRRSVVLSGVAAGIAVAFKFSNGPLAILLPALWVLVGAGWRVRLFNVLLGCVAVGVAFLVAYGYWGAQLWEHYGNPMFPFYDHWFERLRGWRGVAP